MKPEWAEGTAAPGLVHPGGPFHAVPKFGHGDGRDFKLIFRAGGHPATEIESAFFAANDDIRRPELSPFVSWSFEIFARGLQFTTPVLASSSDNSVLAKASASRGP